MNWEELFGKIKADFCGLMDFRIRGNTMEISTSVTTLGNQFVSIFVSMQKNVFVVSDGGWIDLDYYGDTERDQSEDEIVQNIEQQLRYIYQINQVKAREGTIYNFKTTENPQLVSLLVFEVATFVAQLVNTRLTSYAEEKSPVERKLFVNEVNALLRVEFGPSLTVNDSLEAYREEISNIKFNAIIRKPSKTTLLMYVTGSTHGNFVRSAAVATVNFRIANSDQTASKFRKVAIINSQANGYNPHRINEYLQELNSETNIPLLDFYKDQNDLPNLIRAA